MSQYKVYAISGLSGTGKTTIGKTIVKNTSKYVFIDQDSFVVKEKPKVKLSSGIIVNNWDCIEAINWERLNETVIELLKTTNVILVGFALLKKYLKFSIERHVLLVYFDICVDEKTIQKCIETRNKSKLIKNIMKDELMVREIVIPFYKETITHLNAFLICVFEGDKRKDINDLTKKVSVIFFE